MVKAFEVVYSYGPHMDESVFVLAKDSYSAKLATREFLIEEHLWDRVGMTNLTTREIPMIPAGKEFIY